VSLLWTSWIRLHCFCCLNCMWVRCVIRALWFLTWLFFWRSFVCSNNGSFLVSIFALGLGVLVWIGLSIVALVMVVSGVVTLGFGLLFNTLGVGCVSFGGLDGWSKVTLFSVIGGVASSGMVGDGILFNSSSIFWSASISNVPFVFLLFLGHVLGHSLLSQSYPLGLGWVA
jgi:hypothetical protein